jgi:hypothetical protein
VNPATEETTLLERIRVSEHFMVVEYVPAHPPERRAPEPEMAA